MPKTDFDSCSSISFVMSVPESTVPHFLAASPQSCHGQGVRHILNQYLAPRQFQHSTSPYSSPLVVVPKEYLGLRITVNYKKLKQISSLSQLLIPRVDQVLDSMGKGRVLFLLGLVSSFHQLAAAHNGTVPLAAFCTPTGLYEWLVMPQSSSTSVGWFVKSVNKLIKGFEQVVAHLGDTIVFNSDSTAHVETMSAVFDRLRRQKPKPSPSKLIWAPWMPIFWVTPFRPRAYARKRQKCPL